MSGEVVGINSGKIAQVGVEGMGMMTSWNQLLCSWSFDLRGHGFSGGWIDDKSETQKIWPPLKLTGQNAPVGARKGRRRISEVEQA
jgi:hypothetical protein